MDGETPEEGVEHGLHRIFCGGAQNQHIGVALRARLPETGVDALIHEKEHFLLALRGQPVYFIQEEDALVRMVDQALPFPVRPCKRALHISEQEGEQQLGVVGVVGAV